MVISNKITIKYKEKEYEIEKKKDEQKVKPKNGKTTDKEITVKNYEEGSWNHTCECDGEKITIKWGIARHAATWGGGSVGLILVGWIVYYFGFRKKPEEETEAD